MKKKNVHTKKENIFLCPRFTLLFLFMVGLTFSLTASTISGAACFWTGPNEFAAPSYPVAVNSLPGCSIVGPATVCPFSSNGYSAPDGMNTYAWSLDAADNVYFESGTEDDQQVFVITGSACNISFTLSLTVIDSTGYQSTCTQVVSVIDDTNPILTGGANSLTEECDGAGNTAAFDEWMMAHGWATAWDDCTVESEITWTNDYEVGNWVSDCGNSKHVDVVFTATDHCNNSVTTSGSITIVDTQAPQITPPSNIICDSTVFRYINAGLFTYNTVSDEFDATADDICGMGTFSCDLTGATNASNLTTLAGQPFNFGQTTVTWKATDACLNASSCSFIVIVDNGLPTTTSVTVSPSAQQYSDKVTFGATVVSGEGSGVPGGTVLFKVGTQAMGVADVQPDGTATLPDVALVEPEPFGTPPTGQMAPTDPTRAVTAIYSGKGLYSTSVGTAELTITCENANMNYNGGNYFIVNPNTLTGTVLLSAVVNDTNDISQGGARGDIRNTNITFSDATSALATVPVALINPNVTTEGIVVYDFNAALNNTQAASGGIIYEVGTNCSATAGAGNYYCGSAESPATVVLAMPGLDFVTGGGYIFMTNSSGQYPGMNNATKRMNFGLVMKSNKNGNKLKGNINIIYRGLYVGSAPEYQGQPVNYQITGNTINELTVSDVTEGSMTFKKAIITTRANFKIILGNGKFENKGGNHNLIITAWEYTGNNTGQYDRISVRLIPSSGSGILFSSNGSGGNTTWQTLNGGKVEVKSDSIPPPGMPTVTGNGTNAGALKLGIDEGDGALRMKIYPNPFAGKATIGFSVPATGDACLEVYNLMGVKVATLYHGRAEAGRYYTVEFNPGNANGSEMFFCMLGTDHEKRISKMIMIR